MQAVEPLEAEIRQLADSLRGVSDEQSYLVLREQVHRGSKNLSISNPFTPTPNQLIPSITTISYFSFLSIFTPLCSPFLEFRSFHFLSSTFIIHRSFVAAESTFSRVLSWSLIETGALIAVCLWQVFYLKRFFEVKRVL